MSDKRASVGSAADDDAPSQSLLAIFKKKKTSSAAPALATPPTSSTPTSSSGDTPTKNKSTTPRKVAIDPSATRLSLNLSAAKPSSDLPELNLSQASPAQHRQRPRPNDKDAPAQQATVKYYFLGDPAFQALDDFELFKHFRENEDRFAPEAGASTPFPFHKTKIDRVRLASQAWDHVFPSSRPNQFEFRYHFRVQSLKMIMMYSITSIPRTQLYGYRFRKKTLTMPHTSNGFNKWSICSNYKSKNSTPSIIQRVRRLHVVHVEWCPQRSLRED